MNFLCDVHISYKLVRYLTNNGHSVIHVNELPEKWHTKDSQICQLADQKSLIVITKDEDFRNSFLLRKTPRKLIRIVLGNISNEVLLEIIEKNLPAIESLNNENGFYLEIGNSTNVYLL